MKKLFLIILSLILLVGCFGKKDEATKEEGNNDVVKQEEVEQKVEEKQDIKVSFMGIGDNLIHQVISERADEVDGESGNASYDYHSIYEFIKEDIQEADLAFINQETILGGEELDPSGYPCFNTPADMAQDLSDVGFDIINTATNHSLDRHFQGIKNSSKTWSKYKNIIAAGTYVSTQDRETIRVIERKGIKFAFLAYTYGTNGIEPEYDFEVAYFDDDKIKEDVARAKQVSDAIIVSAHWGDENSHEESEFQKHYAQLFADLGVDVVVGTHPHVIQPVVFYTGENGNKMPVIYSLGNGVSGMVEFKNIVEGMIKFDFVKDGETNEISIQNIRWIPLVDHYQSTSDNFYDGRYNFRIFKLSDYTDIYANHHALNLIGENVSVERIRTLTHEVIGKYVDIENNLLDDEVIKIEE